MRKIILGITTLGVILVAGGSLSENVPRFDAERPTPKTPTLEPLAERLSRATIPVSVPIATVGEALESRTPQRSAKRGDRTKRGGQGGGNFSTGKESRLQHKRRHPGERFPHRKSDTQGELARLPESLRNKNRYTKGRYPDKAHRKS